NPQRASTVAAGMSQRPTRCRTRESARAVSAGAESRSSAVGAVLIGASPLLIGAPRPAGPPPPDDLQRAHLWRRTRAVEPRPGAADKRPGGEGIAPGAAGSRRRTPAGR